MYSNHFQTYVDWTDNYEWFQLTELIVQQCCFKTIHRLDEKLAYHETLLAKGIALSNASVQAIVIFHWSNQNKDRILIFSSRLSRTFTF